MVKTSGSNFKTDKLFYVFLKTKVCGSNIKKAFLAQPREYRHPQDEQNSSVLHFGQFQEQKKSSSQLGEKVLG